MEATDYTYEHLLPALFNDKDICIDDWVDDFFSEFDGSYAHSPRTSTFVGFINEETEIRLHYVVNRLIVELPKCVHPAKELIDSIVEYFTIEKDNAESSFISVHWLEDETTINFQYYCKPG